MRIHLGHHFYGAGNLGDDFMLAGFLAAMHRLAPGTPFSCSVPFALGPMQSRFPAIQWLPYEPAHRAQAIADCDVWLGLGGSPFQSAQSRWFIDHLLADADLCRRARKPMFFLGVGVQSSTELMVPEVQGLCANAAGIWTRDPASAERIVAVAASAPVDTGADLAHIFFRNHTPAAAQRGRVTLVANFDFGSWIGQETALRSLNKLPANDRVWLAQESRELPGAERALFAALSPVEKRPWRLVIADDPSAPLEEVIGHWPSGEWLMSARYHAALAGAWAGSKIVVLSTNEKLRAAAHDIGATLLSPEADEAAATRALADAVIRSPPHALATKAEAACAAFVRAAAGRTTT